MKKKDQLKKMLSDFSNKAHVVTKTHGVLTNNDCLEIADALVALSQGSEKFDEQRRFDIEDQLRHSRTLPKVCQKLLFEAFLKRAQQLSKTPANACAFCELTALHFASHRETFYFLAGAFALNAGLSETAKRCFESSRYTNDNSVSASFSVRLRMAFSSLSDEQRHQTQAYFAERETKA